MKKKWIYLILILIITIPVVYLYVGFNGNFISKWKAKQTAIQYLESVYDKDDFTYTSTTFNFKDGTYIASYSYGDEYEASIAVGGILWPTNIEDTYVDYKYYDEEKNAQITGKASKELAELLKEKYPMATVEYYIDVPSTASITGDNFDIHQKTPFKPTIWIELTGETLSDDQAFEIAKGIKKTFDDEGIYYMDFSISQAKSTFEDGVETVTYVHNFKITKEEIKKLK